ncbi:MAG: hypothetical protein ACRDY7_16940 [Acidimicrobiia bacterium]
MTTTMEMATLFVAPDGDLYISFLDEREAITAAIEGRPEPDEHDHDAPRTHDADAHRPFGRRGGDVVEERAGGQADLRVLDQGGPG